MTIVMKCQVTAVLVQPHAISNGEINQSSIIHKVQTETLWTPQQQFPKFAKEFKL